MRKLWLKVALVALLVLVGFRSAEASRISISEGSDTGAGTIINDGVGDASSSNGSATGGTTLMSDLGLNDLTLLAALHITGSITNEAQQSSVVPTSANLTALRLYGTLANECATCATANDVKLGGSLHFQNIDSNNAPILLNNVLFAFSLVGPSLSGIPWPDAAPSSLGTQSVQLGAQLDFQLTQAQIDFIVARMSGYSASDVSIGLGAAAVGINGLQGGEPVTTAFEVNPVPEPGTIFLLATGVVPMMLRRRRRTTH